MMLKISVRNYSPAVLVLGDAERVRVLTEDGTVAKLAAELAVGDVLLGAGIVTAIEGDERRAA